MTHFRRLLAGGIVGGAFAVLAFAAPARAADNGSFSIEPSPRNGVVRSSFDLSLHPGVTARDSFTIINKTGAPISFDLYTADAYDDTNGAFVLRGAKQARLEVGAWVQLPVKLVTVPARAEYVLPFTVRAPANTTPGDRAGGIVALARAATAAHGARGTVVDLRRGVGVRVYVRVLGALHPGLHILEVRYRPETSWTTLFGSRHAGRVTYTVENTGNVRLAPRSFVTVAGFNTERSNPVQLPDLLPGASTVITTPVAGLRGLGTETATAVVQGPGATARASSSAFVFPWALAAVPIVLVLLAAWVVVWLVRRSRRRRRARTHADQHAAAPEEEASTDAKPDVEAVEALKRAVDDATLNAPSRSS